MPTSNDPVVRTVGDDGTVISGNSLGDIADRLESNRGR